MDEKNSNKNRHSENPTNDTSNNNKISSPEENNEKLDFTDKILFGKYKVIKKIGEGSQSTIYSGENIKTNEGIAIKVEKKTEGDCLLEQEIKMLIRLKEHEGIVNIITCGKSGKYIVLIEKLLGKSLDLLFLDSSKNFTLSDICQIAIQCLDRLEFIHSKGIIHCDIKPENFAIGLKDPNVIYLIDFGLCQDYKNLKTGKHIEFSFTGYMTGTARYASRNALRGKALSRRDDMESFIYMILYFLSKKLPWQGVRAKTLTGRYKKIFIYKEQFKYEEFCKNYPKEITTIVKYIRNLSFKERPNYEYMKKLFKKILLDNNSFISDYFSWMINMKNIEIKRKRANSEAKSKIEQKKIIQSSILKLSNVINPKESTLGITHLKLSKLQSKESLDLGESQVTVYADDNKEQENNINNDNNINNNENNINNINNENNINNNNENNINNDNIDNNDDIFNKLINDKNDDIINNIKEVTEMPIEEEIEDYKENYDIDNDNDNNDGDNEENNDNTDTNNFAFSTEAKIKQELEKYGDDEKVKKYELKKELEIIKEEEDEYDDDFEDISKKRGGSVHIYYNNINNYNFKSNKNISSSCFKKNEHKIIKKELNKENNEENKIEKDVNKENKESIKEDNAIKEKEISINKKDENKENIKSENKKNEIEEKINKKNENEEINDINKQKENNENKKENELINNDKNKNLSENKEILKEEEKKEIKIEIIKNNLEEKEDKEVQNKSQNIKEDKNNENIINIKNNNSEIKIEAPKTEVRSSSFSHKITTNKLKEINSNLLSNKEKKEINKQKNYTDEKIKYSSIGSEDYAQMKKGKKKVRRKVDGKNKNQNCIIF